MVLFPFREYIWFYAGFLLFVLSVLAVDLGVFHRKAHVIGMREAVGLSIFWITLALLFNFGFYLFCKHEFSQNPQLMALSGFDPDRQARYSALEFLTGFIVEKSLAVDNLFIFVVLFRFFSIPAQSQHKILFWGILGAIFFPHHLHRPRRRPPADPLDQSASGSFSRSYRPKDFLLPGSRH